MALQEIYSLLYEKKLNTKCNHYLFPDLEEKDIFSLLQAPKTSQVHCLKEEYDLDIVSTQFDNIPVNMENIPVREVLSYTLYRLSINERLPFDSKMALLRFRGILRENQKMVQWIFTGLENMDLEDQKTLNEVLWFNTYLWNANILLTTSNLVTYRTKSGNILDDRENYQKIYIQKENK